MLKFKNQETLRKFMDMFLKMYVATKPLNDTLVDH